MTRLVDDATCAALLRPRDVAVALAAAHIAHHRGAIAQPVPTALDLPGHGRLDAERRPRHVLMSAADGDLTVVKTLLDAPARRDDGGPAQRSVLAVHSTRTGDCLALLDGRTLTRVRTAAATVLAVATLARQDLRVLGVLGAGALALEHLRAARDHLDPAEVVLWSRTPASVEALAASARELGLRARVADSPAAVAASADAVVTVTPATDPLLMAGDLRPGLHVSAVGSPPRPGYREVDAGSFARADLVVVDDRAVALAESAQVRDAVAAGFDGGALVEIGAVLAGDHPGRTDPDQITLHSSIGVALQDLATVRLILERLGTSVP
ncbi:ornithine cyclodeaminase family protein [Serinibacter arcticus]|uniref:Ornithine cyclodeaminase n=1 Tax=Serinibacter arcticus TaxID=1655435 RepID=A0A4Z1EAB1_9MICO|nr:ornithine cyclodeaminase family protein [Serinibacter arcticus]TGO06381.1 Ornithine cyclodeaminase [Serinibacter arcticus]